MLDEEMDHIIREAANNHHPAYNDKAWEKMELKLDKHLPQKTDRRRLIFFLLFFILLGAGILFTVNKMMGDNDTVADKNSGHDKGVTLTADNSVGKDLNNSNTVGQDMQDGNAVSSPPDEAIQNGDIAGNSRPDNGLDAGNIANRSQQGTSNNNAEYLNPSSRF